MAVSLSDVLHEDPHRVGAHGALDQLALHEAAVGLDVGTGRGCFHADRDEFRDAVALRQFLAMHARCDIARRPVLAFRDPAAAMRVSLKAIHCRCIQLSKDLCKTRTSYPKIAASAALHYILFSNLLKEVLKSLAERDVLGHRWPCRAVHHKDPALVVFAGEGNAVVPGMELLTTFKVPLGGMTADPECREAMLCGSVDDPFELWCQLPLFRPVGPTCLRHLDAARELCEDGRVLRQLKAFHDHGDLCVSAALPAALETRGDADGKAKCGII
jgi:hypothetical protein